MKITSMRTFSFTVVSLIAMLFSCQEEEVKKKRTFTPSNQEEISTDFGTNTFTSDTMLSLLKEINICDPTQQNPEDLDRPACLPKFFRFFPYAKDAQLADAFLLLTKSGTHGYKIRRLYVFQRENGRLIQVNRFMGNLIAKRKTKGNYDDLIVRFSDGEDNFFNCLYSWERDKYVFKKVEAINEARIKANLQDSMNVEIHKLILENGMEI